MPAAESIQERTTEALGNNAHENYAEAKRIVAAAGSLREAVENGNFLDGLQDDHQAEARAVLDALPADVDAAFMASLRTALDGNKKIAFKWEEGEFAHEARTHTDGTVQLVLQCPNGETFRNQATST